jgi:hypothetical protein
MAQIDFSHASVRQNPEFANRSSMIAQPYFGAGTTSSQSLFAKINGDYVAVGNASITVIERTLYKQSLLYTGEITNSSASSCTSLFTNSDAWEIYNISYSYGDTFSFKLDFDVTIS